MYRKYIKLDAVPGGDPVRIHGARNNLAVIFQIPESFAEYDGDIPAVITATSGSERLTFEPVWLVCDKKEGE